MALRAYPVVYNLLKEAEAKDFAVGVIHSHPAGPLGFSRRDDAADKELFRIAFDRFEGRCARRGRGRARPPRFHRRRSLSRR
jgi:hypothetical protein